MAQLTIPPFNLPAGVTSVQVINALAIEWGYQLKIPDPQTPGALIDNPAPKDVYVRTYLANLIKSIYLRQRNAQLAQTAITTAGDPGDIT